MRLLCEPTSALRVVVDESRTSPVTVSRKLSACLWSSSSWAAWASSVPASCPPSPCQGHPPLARGRNVEADVERGQVEGEAVLLGREARLARGRGEGRGRRAREGLARAVLRGRSAREAPGRRRASQTAAAGAMDSDEDDDLGRGAHERALFAALEPELGRGEDEEGAGEGGAIAALRPVITEREGVDVGDIEDDEEDDGLEDDDFEDSPSLRGVGDLDAELAPGMRRRTPSSEDSNSSLEQEMGDEATSDEEYFAGPRPRGNSRRQESGRVHFDLDAEGAEYETPRQAAWEAQLGAWGHSLVMFSSIGIGLYVASKIVNIDFVRFLGMVFLGGLGMLAARPSYNPRLSTMIEHNLNEAELETIRTFVQRRVDLHDAPGAARDEYLGRLKRSSVGMGMHSMAGSSSRGSGLHSSAAASGYPSHYIRYSSGGLGPVPENEEDLYF